MKRYLAIGYGNPLRGDDGLGWFAVDSVVKDPALGGWDIAACHQLSVELSESISRRDRVVFIDAREGGTPGEISVQSIEPDSTLPGSFSHHLTPGMLLACSKVIYGKAPEAFLITVAGESFRFHEGLSPRVAAAVPLVRERLKSL